jgi:hypothetical protein
MAASIGQTSQGSRDRSIPVEGTFERLTTHTSLEGEYAATQPELSLSVRQPLVTNGKRGRTVLEYPEEGRRLRPFFLGQKGEEAAHRQPQHAQVRAAPDWPGH